MFSELARISSEDVKKIADRLSFSEQDMMLIIPYIEKHAESSQPTVEDYIKEWEYNWYRNSSFQEIVDYEFQYINDYDDIETEEELENFLINTVVKQFDDKVNRREYAIYKIHDNLWIEVNV